MFGSSFIVGIYSLGTEINDSAEKTEIRLQGCYCGMTFLERVQRGENQRTTEGPNPGNFIRFLLKSIVESYTVHMQGGRPSKRHFWGSKILTDNVSHCEEWEQIGVLTQPEKFILSEHLGH